MKYKTLRAQKVNKVYGQRKVVNDVDIVVVEGGMVEFSVTATDAENDNLTIQLLNAPNGMILDENCMCIHIYIYKQFD